MSIAKHEASLVAQLVKNPPAVQKTQELWVLSPTRDFLGGSDGDESACNVGDLSLIPGSGWSPGGGHGNLLQYSCLENPMNRGAWWATVHGAAKSWTWLSDLAKRPLHYMQPEYFVLLFCICTNFTGQLRRSEKERTGTTLQSLFCWLR